jgi:hypothetical protein
MAGAFENFLRPEAAEVQGSAFEPITTAQQLQNYRQLEGRDEAWRGAEGSPWKAGEPGWFAKLMQHPGTQGLLNAANFIGPGPKAGKLPMDAASRLARAKDMGFDTKTTWYHGTPEPDLQVIQPGKRDPGAWFTTDMQNAANYARGADANVHSVRLKAENPYVVEFPWDVDPPTPMHKGEKIPFSDNVAIVNHAQKQGYDSVHFPDGNFSESGNTMVVFRPQQIRDVDAVFDPSNANSPNLMASRLGPFLGAGGAAGAFIADDAQAKPRKRGSE